MPELRRSLFLIVPLILGLVSAAFGADEVVPDAAKQKEAIQFIVTFTLLPLALYPIGLAIHLFLAGLAPNRSEDLALDIQENFWKSLLLGLANGLGLLILAGVLSKPVPAAAALAGLALCLFVVCGLHGAARSVGTRILERVAHKSPPNPIIALALGWFVVLYVSCVPVVGWMFGLSWILRGIGGVVLQVAGRRAPISSELDEA